MNIPKSQTIFLCGKLIFSIFFFIKVQSYISLLLTLKKINNGI